MMHILKNIRYLYHLEWLDLSSNLITDTSMYRFSEEMTHLVRLRSVDLRHNKLGDLSLESLRNAIVRMPRLEHVLIAENCGYYQDATKLLTHVKAKPSLRHIGVDMNKIPREGVLSMRPISYLQDGQNVPAIDGCDVTKMNSDDSEGDEADDADYDVMNATSRSARLNDSACHDVSLEVLDGGTSIRPALLSGRPDEHRAVPLRRHSASRRPSLPRMRDVRRSWHGVGLTLHHSLRRTRESLNDLALSDGFQGMRNSTSNLRSRCVARV